MDPASKRGASSLRSPLTALALLALLGATADPATADWLLTTDGTRIETDGAWVERGKLLVFTDMDGQLVSLRLADVDLEASRRLTAELEEAARRPAAPPPPPPPPPPSAYRLTDDDVAHVGDAGPAGEALGGGDEEATTDAEDEAPPLLGVVAWEREDNADGDGLEVRATIENQGTDVALNITVEVSVYDDDGDLLASAPARLGASGLVPGQTTELIAEFPGLFDFAAVDFDIDQRALATRPVEEMPSQEDNESFSPGAADSLPGRTP